MSSGFATNSSLQLSAFQRSQGRYGPYYKFYKFRHSQWGIYIYNIYSLFKSLLVSFKATNERTIGTLIIGKTDFLKKLIVKFVIFQKISPIHFTDRF